MIVLINTATGLPQDASTPTDAQMASRVADIASGLLVWFTVPDGANLANYLYTASPQSYALNPTYITDHAARIAVIQSIATATTAAQLKAILVAILKEINLGQ